MRYRILPYRQGSRGARALADELGGKVLRLEGSTFVAREGDVVINWGRTESAPFLSSGGYDYLNPVFDIRNASNKLLFFRMMREAGLSDLIPPFWENIDEIPDDAFPIVCRTVLAGHSGDGIVIAGSRPDLVPAPLYTQYIKKSQEFRVHVGRRYFAEDNNVATYSYDVVAIQRKARRLEVPDDEVDWAVRNHANGFAYVRQGFAVPELVVIAAQRALEASGLDFGAVDVIYNNHHQRAIALEINTAPGLEGQTVKDYADFFRSLT
jgi:glutathione synthase/RimK-type ligase-like ATP-grasp enzyme